MEVSNFILSKKDNDFSYRIKFVPDKVLNKMTDCIIVSVDRSINCNLLFKKNINRKFVNNKYSLTRDELKSYIKFLNGINQKLMNNICIKCEEFNVKNGEKIIIDSLNENCIKMCSIKNYGSNQNRNFFMLFKHELTVYINALKQIYFGNKPIVKYDSQFLLNPITKREYDEVYLEALYVFANGALDLRNRERFNAISSEIRNIEMY